MNKRTENAVLRDGTPRWTCRAKARAPVKAVAEATGGGLAQPAAAPAGKK
jgi:chemotaxis protein MotB